MGLEENFNLYLELWRGHIRENSFMSDFQSYLNSPYYEALISLGPRILPHIQTDLEGDRLRTPWDLVEKGSPGHLWAFALSKVTDGAFRMEVGAEGTQAIVKRVIPGMVGVDTNRLVDHMISWIEENKHKYL